MDFEQFYPTPIELGRKLCATFQEKPVRVLEPSAGRGHLLQAFRERFSRLGSDSVDVYEINQEHHAALREQGATICGLDFAESTDLSIYSHIVMNPPFRDGVRHVLHAWNRLFSGEIAAILNASGVREPATKDELRLQKLIAQYGHAEYVEEAFLSPDTLRKTSVEVALIYLCKKPTEGFWNGDILDRLDPDNTRIEIDEPAQGLSLSAGQIPALVRAYQAAWQARKDSILADHRSAHFIRFFQSEMNKVLGREHYDSPSNLHQDLQKAYVSLRHMAWMSVLHTPEFQKHLTRKAQREIEAQFDDIEKMAFTVTNIYGFLQGLAMQQGNINAQMVCDLFDKITYANSENCLFYRWKSNEKHRVGMALKRKRFILFGFSLEGWRSSLGYSEKQDLAEIDKIFALVDGKREPEISLCDLFDRHLNDLRYGARLESTYFEVRFYPGIGTIHFFPKDQKLIDRINTIVGKHRKWMPESYTPKAEPDYKAAEDLTKRVMGKMSHYALRDALGGRYRKESEQELQDAFEEAAQEGGTENFWTLRLAAGKKSKVGQASLVLE